MSFAKLGRDTHRTDGNYILQRSKLGQLWRWWRTVFFPSTARMSRHDR